MKTIPEIYKVIESVLDTFDNDVLSEAVGDDEKSEPIAKAMRARLTKEEIDSWRVHTSFFKEKLSEDLTQLERKHLYELRAHLEDREVEIELQDIGKSKDVLVFKKGH
jgi:hypothetical protein